MKNKFALEYSSTIFRFTDSMAGAFWTAEDSFLLLSLIDAHGSNWKLISEKLGKTIGAVRNRAQRMHRGALKNYVQQCRLCGQPRRGHICTFSHDNEFEELVGFLYDSFQPASVPEC